MVYWVMPKVMGLYTSFRLSPLGEKAVGMKMTGEYGKHKILLIVDLEPPNLAITL